MKRSWESWQFLTEVGRLALVFPRKDGQENWPPAKSEIILKSGIKLIK